MALNPNISLGVRPLQVPDPLAQMAQVSQIQSAQRQGEVSRMQLEDLKNDRIEMQQFQSQLVANGGSANLDELAKTMLKTPKLFAQGVELTKKLKEQADFERYGRKLYPELFGATAPAGMPAAPVNALATNAAPAPAPVNALAAPASEPYPGYNESIGMTPSAAPARTQQLSPSGKTRQQLEGMIFMAQGNPLFKGMAETAKLELAEMIKPPVRQVVSAGSTVLGPDNQVVFTAPAAQSTLARLQAELALLPKGDPRRPAYEAMIKKETEFAPRAITNVNLPPQQNAFEGELGKGQAKSIIENRAAAQDAASIIDTVNIGRDILKGGVITGAGADFLVNFNQALKTAGVDFGYADAAANSQAYAANMAQNVGKIIKQFGAGTGLSDADRQYAEKMAGGKITLDVKALNKILDINERAARNVITRHNKDVAGIKTNIPLTVEMPAKRAEPAAGNAVTNPQFPGFSVGKP